LAAIRIAPDTHLVQALTDALVSRRGGFATPEERWYRAVSEGFCSDPWLSEDRRQSLAGSRRGRCGFEWTGGEAAASNSDPWL